MYRIGLAALTLALCAGTSHAQSYRFGDESWPSSAFRRGSSYEYTIGAKPKGRSPAAQRPQPQPQPSPWSWWGSDDDDDVRPQKPQISAVPTGPKLLDGGPRPSIAPLRPTAVAFGGGFDVGSIVIDTKGRQLFLVTAKDSALRYPISVGREGFTWTGTEKISRIADWPDWHPPAEMRQRDPKLPEKMTGGVRNPLGAKSLYLGNSLYRIHGTNDAKTIGYAASSGCFRMLNGHVVDLAGRVGVGTKVVVLNALPPGAARVASR